MSRVSARTTTNIIRAHAHHRDYRKLIIVVKNVIETNCTYLYYLTNEQCRSRRFTLMMIYFFFNTDLFYEMENLVIFSNKP